MRTSWQEDGRVVDRVQQDFLETVRTDSKGAFINRRDEDVHEFAMWMQALGRPAQDLVSVTQVSYSMDNPSSTAGHDYVVV
jgi:hypothetical protein